MNCPSCGASLPFGSSFCNVCGTAISLQSSSAYNPTIAATPSSGSIPPSQLPSTGGSYNPTIMAQPSTGGSHNPTIMAQPFGTQPNAQPTAMAQPSIAPQPPPPPTDPYGGYLPPPVPQPAPTYAPPPVYVQPQVVYVPQPVYVAPPRRKSNGCLITSIILLVLAVICGVPAWFGYGVFNNFTKTMNATATSNVIHNAYLSIDGVDCDSSEQFGTHVHTHLSLYILGQPFTLPKSIGIPADQSCYYWLHTHDTSGIIHIEAPDKNTYYTLGNFLDIWKVFSLHGLNYPTELSLEGWRVYVNGKLYAGNFKQIQLTSHELITMVYKTPGAKPDTTYNWSNY